MQELRELAELRNHKNISYSVYLLGKRKVRSKHFLRLSRFFFYEFIYLIDYLYWIIYISHMVCPCNSWRIIFYYHFYRSVVKKGAEKIGVTTRNKANIGHPFYRLRAFIDTNLIDKIEPIGNYDNIVHLKINHPSTIEGDDDNLDDEKETPRHC